MRKFYAVKKRGLALIVIVICTLQIANAATLNLKLYIQSYYQIGGTMYSPLYNSLLDPDPNNVDSVTVSLIDPVTLALVESGQGMLHADGTCTVNFSGAVEGGSYYINICQRAALQTMSNDPVTIASVTAYDFTVAATQAYGSNMIEVETGVWALYSGDINHDCIIDAADSLLLSDDINNATFGYSCSDLNGDGFVDANDYVILEVNIQNGVSCDNPVTIICPACSSVPGQPLFRAIIIHDYSLTNSAAQSILSGMGALVVEGSDYFTRVTIYTNQLVFDAVKTLPWVLFADTNLNYTADNNQSRTLMKVDKIQSSPWSNNGNSYQLSGAGVKIGIWDEGVPDINNSDFSGRLNIMEALNGCPNIAANVFNHPTHVAGTLAGSGSYILQNAGIAPKATMYAWNLNSGACAFVSPYPSDEMKSAVANQSIVISQNSWGLALNPNKLDCKILGQYNSLCQAMDRVVRQQNLSIIVSAGNDRENSVPLCGIEYGSIRALGTSKNVIAVGAVSNTLAMYYKSNWGPCDDGRLKPDVVAKGVSVTSCMPANSNPKYAASSGTSMAAPAVSGVAALLVERFRNANNGITPRPDLLKNFILNTATDIWNPGPDFQTGYGLVNAELAVQTIDKGSFQLGSVSASGVQNLSLYVCENKLKVMLVWTDIEIMQTEEDHLYNDLDLELISPSGSVTKYPLTLNHLSPTSNAISAANHKDNVEQVVIDNPAQGIWTIRVKGFEVLQGPQSYALTWIGGSVKPADAVIRDVTVAQGGALDSGNEPDLASDVMWISPYILLRQHEYTDPLTNLNFLDNTGGTVVHQNATYNLPSNWVYVKVVNQGCNPVSGEVKLYWAKASPSLSWPVPWDGSITTPLLMGNPIIPDVPQLVVNLLPGESKILTFEWEGLPNSSYYSSFGPDQNHFCLLTRFESVDDPMTFPEQINGLYGNVRKNNNIAWKNIVLSGDIAPGIRRHDGDGVIVGNYSSSAMFAKLKIDAPNAADGKSFYNYGIVQINLGATLFQKWQAGGMMGAGITHDNDSLIWVHSQNDWIGNILINPGELYGVSVEFITGSQPCAGDSHSFRLDLIQYEQLPGGDNIIGGVSYPINFEETQPIIISPSIVPVSCSGTGSINLVVAGGVPPYSYYWNTNATTQNISGLAAGIYIVTVTDSIGCSVTDSIVLTSPPPVSAGPITGTASLCTPGGQTLSYSIAAVPTAFSYAWSVPAGVIITSGQGTTSIIVSISAAAVANGVKGNLCVSVISPCGISVPSCLTLDINAVKPVTPPSISGPVKVCPGDVVTYSIALVARATNYIWTLPASMTLISGAGTNIISATANAGYTGGTLSVAAANSCGASPLRSRVLSLNPAHTPGTIAGQASGVCNQLGVVYSIAPVSNATSYLWSVIGGTGIGSNTGASYGIDWRFDSLTSVSVAAVNGCGNGPLRTVNISGKPAVPGTITGSTAVCTGGTYHYSISTVQGASSYLWTAPGTIVSGQGTKEIDVTYGASLISNQVITVKAINACGTSAARILNAISSSFCARKETLTSDAFIYPNPATDDIYMEFNADCECDYTIQLTDMTGRIIQNTSGKAYVGSNKYAMNVENVSGGLYMITFRINDEVKNYRITIE